ncbi:MAG: selenide, water dikinase SelD [Veillonella parvula]|nr:selenide, water dikinase SelD [Veillonella parvula]
MVRLTDYVTSGGCACKIGPHILNRVLKAVTPVTNKHVLADMTGADDAGVYQISDTFALVQTLDFFTPVVNDPDLFGKIAAANALSDVYAMGGTPLTAMNIVGFPVPLVEQGVLTDVLNGAGSIVAEAGAAIVGGHSIENKGDVLVLTKRIGTGIMNNALKAGLFPVGTEQAVTSMSTLNRVAAEVAHNFTVHACTDVTGFSLMGHSVEMASASDVTIHIKAYDIPLFDDVIEAAQMGLIPAASYGNRKAITEVQVDEDLDPVWTDIVFDPQTSGGLLFSVPASESETLVEAFYKAGIDCAAIVGTVESFSGLAVRVTK